MILQHIHQQILGRIHHDPHADILQTLADIPVHRLRHHCGDAPGEHQRVLLRQPGQLPIQPVDIVLLDGRSHAVDLRLLIRTQLDIDPGHSFFHHNKIRTHVLHRQKPHDLPASESCHEAQRGRFKAQILQHQRDIDALSSRKQQLFIRPIDLAGLETVYRNNVIQ